MNKLYFDLEMSPQVVACYGRWDIRLNEEQVIVPSYLMNFSYMWEHEGIIHSEAIWHHNKVRPMDEYSDKKVVKKLWKLLDKADIVVAHNAKRFDIKKANMLFLKHNLTPPSPYQVVDTLQVAKRHFGFDSNALGSLAIRMGCTYKKDSGGIMKMYHAAAGDKDAQNHLEEYCNGDIQTMYEVDRKMLGWNTMHPNVSTGCNCPECGSFNVQKRGFWYSRTKKTKNQRFVCKDCGQWSKDSKNLLTKDEKTDILYSIK